jgi:predicted transcriptional regulator
MTHTYCLKRLLEHGPMKTAEIIECTRWKPRQVHTALRTLLGHGLINFHLGVYEAVK